MTPDEELKILRADWAALVAQVTGAESRRAGDLRRGETFTNSGGEVTDHEITLPPLPEPRLEQHELELWGQNVCADLYDDRQMRAYARAAILLDRQQRAAPSAEPVNLNDPAVQKRLAAQWGYVSALSAEPVAWLYQHGMTGRTRIVMPDQVFTNAPGQWLMVGPLYQHPPAPSAEPVLDNIEQYRMQMAGICTAALGYWTDGDDIHPDYDTPALREVARLYAKYRELHDATPPAPSAEPVAWRYKPMIGSPWSMSDDGYYISCKRDAGYIIEALAVVQPAPSAEPADVAALRAERDALLGIMRRANDAIEALDGTNVENEKLVDDYRAVMAKEPK